MDLDARVRPKRLSTTHPAGFEHFRRPSCTISFVEEIYRPRVLPTAIEDDAKQTTALDDPTGFPSPTTTASTALSPVTPMNGWDDLENPNTRCPSEFSTTSFTTPLTPVSTHGKSMEHTSSSESPLFRKSKSVAASTSKTSTKLEQDATMPEIVVKEETKPAVVTPKNIFGNLKAQLDDIATAGPKNGETLKLQRKPSINFMGDSMPTAALSTKAQSVDYADNWTDQKLSRYQKDLEQLLPRSIYARLRDNPSRCVASQVTNLSKRCSNRARDSCTHAVELVGKVCQHYKRKNYSSMLRDLEELITMTMCGVHVKAALEKPKDKARILRIRNLVEGKPQTRVQQAATDEWIGFILKWQSSSPGHDRESPQQSYVPLNSTTQEAMNSISSIAGHEATTESSRLKPAIFKPYLPKRIASLTVTEILTEIVNDPLNSTDLKKGYIYMFWDGGLGMIKIGHTHDSEACLKQWTQKCRQKHYSHTPLRQDDLVEIAHASRVKRLIHCELKDVRVQGWCGNCQQAHRDWFQVTEAHALRVYQKWVDWISQAPYRYDAELGEWGLRSGMRRTVSEVCEPVPFLPVEPIKARRRSGNPVVVSAKRRSKMRSSQHSVEEEG